MNYFYKVLHTAYFHDANYLETQPVNLTNKSVNTLHILSNVAIFYISTNNWNFKELAAQWRIMFWIPIFGFSNFWNHTGSYILYYEMTRYLFLLMYICCVFVELDHYMDNTCRSISRFSYIYFFLHYYRTSVTLFFFNSKRVNGLLRLVYDNG